MEKTDLTLPAFYIAVITFHQEMIPTQFGVEVTQGSRAGHQHCWRLGCWPGSSTGWAGFPLMVIVVALTGVAFFMAPTYNLALTLRLIRFLFMLLAATMGLFGVMVGLLAVLIHLVGLRSL